MPKEFAGNLLISDVNGKTIVISCGEDCPLGSYAVPLLHIVCVACYDIGIYQFGGIIQGGGSRHVGRRDVEVSGKQRSMELEGVLAAGAGREACQFLQAAWDCRATHKKACLSVQTYKGEQDVEDVY